MTGTGTTGAETTGAETAGAGATGTGTAGAEGGPEGAPEAAELLDRFDRLSAASPDGRRVELLEGRILVTTVGTAGHAKSVTELAEALWDESRIRRGHTGIGLRLPDPVAEARVLPDLVVAPRGSFRDEDVWQAPDPVLLVAEVVAPATASRDHGPKARGYARAGIPIYVIVDRAGDEITVHSAPSGDRYARRTVHRLGTVVPLPDPLGFAIDTAEF
ncbi:Uma2 family endonuclease [Streptomyces sp. NPDC046203]|uniref:Uma2 family endonuclease n=1 Tax=Streptomyces sp. NPDC046203 TaxID=3154602 RepID=UPI0033FDE48D